MRIAFVVGSLSGGGAERIVSVLASEMAEKGHDVYVILIASVDRSYKISNRVKIINCSTRYKKWGFLKRVLDMRKQIKGINLDVCVSFTVAVNLYSILSCAGQKVKLIIAERNDPQYDPISKIPRVMRTVLYPFAHGFVFQTANERNFFSKAIQKRSTIIPNPVNPDMPEPFTGERSCRIVTAARLVPQKNIRMALDAFSMVYRNNPEYTFEVYGQGPMLEELKNYSASKGIKEAVIFKGNSKKLYDEILDAQAFILSSNYEGMSNSMLEAMALGIPTISTDYPSGGASAIIENNINGILVPVGDATALSEAIESLIKNYDFAKKISQNSVKVRKALNIELILTEWIKYIEGII